MRDPPIRIGLRVDKRDLGLLEEVASAGHAGRPDADAHARADEPRPAVEVERWLELRLDPFGEGKSGVGVRTGQEHAERVATEASDGVGRGEDRGDPGADLAEDAVADRMTEALVHDLEPVDVQEHDRHRLTFAPHWRRSNGVDDSLKQDLARRQPRDEVPRREGLGLEPGVLEGDRRQLGESRQCIDLRLAEDAVRRTRGEADHADDLATDGEWDADARADPADEVWRGLRPRVVVVNGVRLSGSVDDPADPAVDLEAIADELLHRADAGVADEMRIARLGQVDVAVRHAEQASGPHEDRVEELVRAAAVEEAHRRLVEGRDELVAGVSERGALRQEQGLVGGLDEGVLVPGVVGMAGHADADRDVRAAAVVRDRFDGGFDPVRDLVRGGSAAVRQQDRELVAAVAIGPIALAGGGLDGPAHCDEQVVTGGMAVPVVVALEPVEIHHQDRDLALWAAREDR